MNKSIELIQTDGHQLHTYPTVTLCNRQQLVTATELNMQFVNNSWTASLVQQNQKFKKLTKKKARKNAQTNSKKTPWRQSSKCPQSIRSRGHGSVIGHAEHVLYLKNCPFAWRIWTKSNTWFRGPTWVHNLNGISTQPFLHSSWQRHRACPGQ